jgi:hypothetical protein
METIKFQTNIPETIALAFAVGKPVSSQFGGDQVMFSLDDGRRMYVSPFVAEKIYAAGISAHTTFTMCKREVSHGNRRSIEFEIGTHNEAAGAPVKASPATAAPVASSAPVSTKATTANPTNGANGNTYTDSPAAVVGRAVPVNAPAAAIPALTLDSNLVDLMSAHMAAIDVAAMAEKYAAEKGLAIRYTSEDVRAMAATIYIAAQKGGGAR